MKKVTLLVLALAALCSLSVNAQLKIRGVFQQGRDADGEMAGSYLAWNSELGKAISTTPQGLYLMQWDGTTLSTPEKNPAVNVEDFFQRTGTWSGVFTDNEKADWANTFNLMSGNSGAGIYNGVITTVHSRTGEDVEDSERFAVRKWDAKTGNLLSGRNDYFSTDMCLESAGMCQNPKDGKMYGLFYLTAQQLPEEILNDPDFFTDEEGDATDTDAGYCLCSIDLETMTIKPITPGLYYGNYVTFAINSEGRAFALTSGGTMAALNGNEDVKVYDIDGNLAGAHLHEFDLSTGMMINEYPNAGTGYCSQAKRQSACFSKKAPNKMYWIGYVNSGKGYSDTGALTNLPDREWKTNGKYDTALYEVDITTGEATRLSLIENRYTFSAMWIDEEDEPALYILGSFNGWNENDMTALTQTEDGMWTVTLDMEAGAEFKLKDEAGNWLGGVTDGNNFIVTREQVEEGTALSLSNPGMNFVMPVAGTWTFTVDKENMTMTIAGEWNEQPKEFEHVYVLGEVNENSWAPNVGLEMNTEDGIEYTVDVKCDGRNNHYNYFSFTTRLAEDADDWGGMAAYRFGAVTENNSDFLVTDEMLNKDLALQAGEAAFQIPAGRYNLLVNLDNMTLNITRLPIIGDVNADGIVDVEDVNAVINIALGFNKPGDFKGKADLNEDGLFDVEDVNMIINIILSNN